AVHRLAVLVDQAALVVDAGRARAAAVDVGLVAVQQAVRARVGARPVRARAGEAVGVHRADLVGPAGRALAAAAVDVGLHAVQHVVPAAPAAAGAGGRRRRGARRRHGAGGAAGGGAAGGGVRRRGGRTAAAGAADADDASVEGVRDVAVLTGGAHA